MTDTKPKVKKLKQRFPRCTAITTCRANITYECKGGPWHRENISLATGETFVFNYRNYTGKYYRKDSATVVWAGRYTDVANPLQENREFRVERSIYEGNGSDSPRVLAASVTTPLICKQILEPVITESLQNSAIAIAYSVSDPTWDIYILPADIGYTYEDSNEF